MLKIDKLVSLPGTVEPEHILLLQTESGIELGVTTKDIDPDIITFKRSITVSGPTSLSLGEVGEYFITGISDLDTFDLTSSDGDIILTGSTFTFVVTNPALETAVFTLDGRDFTVTILSVSINPPAIVSPVDLAENVSLSGLIIHSEAFSVNPASVSDVHVATDWEISTDPEFQTIVASSYGDTVNLTEFPVPS